jgi:ABC-type uncharacterized transport system substrate-binding protein
MGRVPDLAADLVQTNVHVILTAGTESTDAARKATTDIPIVMAAVGERFAGASGRGDGAAAFAAQLMPPC